ncbi:MAG TPA: Lrp/AsnC ligand binding domain-containing protein [Roseiflexaceae bacterium]
MTNSKAYVLIEAQAGQLETIALALRGIPGIDTVEVVTGPYDIIATIKTGDQQAIGRLIMNAFHTIDGIRRTTTCLVIG